MAKQLPYFKWYPADAEMDEDYASMTDQELGFYHRCLNRSWLNDGLPNDLDEISRIFHRTRAYVDKIWERVGKKFTLKEVSCRLVNTRQEEERDAAISKSVKATNSVRTRYERRTKVSLPALARAVSESISVIPITTPVKETKSLQALYQKFLAAWTAPDDEDRVFTCSDIDLGHQVWQSLIDTGAITEANVNEVFEGLERHRQSEKWRQGYVLSVPAFLGWSKDGRPAGLRWKDHPKPAKAAGSGGF